MGLGGDDSSPVSLKAEFTAPQNGKPGRLFITATITPGWHIYSLNQGGDSLIPTKIEVTPSDKFKLTGQFVSSPPPKIEQMPQAFPGLDIETHSDTVTWQVPIELKAGVDPAKLTIEGIVSYQACMTMCIPPQDASFTAKLGPGVDIPLDSTDVNPLPSNEANQNITENATQAHVNPPQTTETPQSPANENLLQWHTYSADTLKKLVGPNFDVNLMKANLKDQQTDSLGWILIFGFLGGLILNVMPCVLPVIGLKILSFVEQSGHNRWNAFSLNIWYSAGLISVFLLLASLAVFARLGWGELFQYPEFNVVLTSVVFAMGLSFLGVWEIPIPGFVSSGKTADLSTREGAAGAFAKGVITTILATPCTGPFMGTAIAWAVGQSPLVTYLVFFSVGLGMASPYLLIGAFPELIRFLPKPGEWMDTFKQIMGFVLLATVVYIFTFMDVVYIVPCFGLLIACWVGCWWIGRTPIYASLGTRAFSWLVAIGIVCIGWVMLFTGLNVISKGKIPFDSLLGVMASRMADRYELKSTQQTTFTFDKSTGARTVLVDFTADWCLTCKTFEATVLNTEPVQKKIEENGVVLLKADCTNIKKESDATKMLRDLGSGGLPTIAIFPAKNPNAVIVFQGAYRQSALLQALNDAGPSLSVKKSDGTKDSSESAKEKTVIPNLP
jgi:thiol:disulfide interchange protein DsbD